ncbi:MAG TPA: threonyl-tRNA synthetase editing domain-containing protein, partial [Candidatus Methanomethylicus sp.]|nr:threonyl-tRNA synthetase editing domain-containing protein [Candidatus Methanomethylicus sp.]
MRLLMIHADFIEYAALEPAVKEPEAIADAGKPKRVEECIVAFCSVEKGDEASPEDIAREAAATIAENARQLKVGRIVVYPYAHLSSD